MTGRLVADGHEVVEFAALLGEIEAATERTRQRRTSLAKPAQAWVSRL